MTIQIQERLAEVILREKENQGTYKNLADAIQAANENVEASPEDRKLLKVDRRKLSNIAEKKKVSLSVYELQAIDTYLARERMRGVEAVFAKPTLIRSLTDTKLVHFLIGAKPQPDKTVVLSRWDVRSMITVIREIHSVSTDVVIDLHDVLLEPSVKRPNEKILNQEVRELLVARTGPSVVCIGSPRACHASEIMLAKMFGVDPFARVKTPAELALPFYFVWSDDQYDALPSSFALRARDVLGRESDDRGWKTVALKTTEPDETHTVDRNTSRWRNYGVVVVQRRETGKLWVVAAGLSGPSTLAVARRLASIGGEPLHEATGKYSPVVWAVVKASVRRVHKPKYEGENRNLDGEQIIVPPRKWQPAK
jgi:hypothetical protein